MENCITHGFTRTFGDEEIRIEVTECENDLIIKVSDNGIGITPENLVRIHENLGHYGSSDTGGIHNSIGIVNISDRIRLEYGADYYLHIYPNEPRGTTVELKIPKNRNLEVLPEIET